MQQFFSIIVRFAAGIQYIVWMSHLWGHIKKCVYIKYINVPCSYKYIHWRVRWSKMAATANTWISEKKKRACRKKERWYYWRHKSILIHRVCIPYDWLMIFQLKLTLHTLGWNYLNLT
jgi:hypothetical protein